MRVILFIGHHKVGSSALQTHLARTAPAALRSGILYPNVTALDAKLLHKCLRAGDSEQPLSRNVTEAHNALAFSMIADQNPDAPIPPFHEGLPSTGEMFAVIRRQIARYKPRTLVLASEVFANFAAISPALIERLIAGLGLEPAEAEVEVFAYLRRVDDYLVSWHGQRARFGQPLRALPKALNHYAKGIHFDYRLMIEGWQIALPKARLVLRPYDSFVRKAGSLRVFAHAMDLRLPRSAATAKTETVNLSLHRGLLDIARRANAKLDADHARQVFDTLLTHGPGLELAANHKVEMWGSDARRRIMADFAPIHDWLSAQVGGPFFDDLDAVLETRPVDEYDVNVQALTALRADHIDAFSPEGAAFIAAFEARRNFPPRAS